MCFCWSSPAACFKRISAELGRAPWLANLGWAVISWTGAGMVLSDGVVRQVGLLDSLVLVTAGVTAAIHWLPMRAGLQRG